MPFARERVCSWLLYREERGRLQASAFDPGLTSEQREELDQAWEFSWRLHAQSPGAAGKWEVPLEEPELEPTDFEVVALWGLVDGQLRAGVPRHEKQGTGKQAKEYTVTPYALDMLAVWAAIDGQCPALGRAEAAACLQAMFATKAGRRVAYRVPSSLREELEEIRETFVEVE